MGVFVRIFLLVCIFGFFSGVCFAETSSIDIEDEHQTLIADFRADIQSGTAPMAVQFTDTSTGSPGEWYWDFGDGKHDTVKNPLHTYEKPGIYSASLSVTGLAGSDMKTRLGYISVSEAPLTSSSMELTQRLIKEEVTIPTSNPTILFTPTPTESPTPLSTVSPGETTSPFGSESTLAPIPFSDTGKTETDLLHLFSPSTHADFIQSPNGGLAPLVVRFTDNSSGNPTGWSWDFGDGTSSDLPSPEHVYSIAGTYTVRLTVQGSQGSDTKVGSSPIEVSLMPEASVRAQPRTGSAPLMVAFTDNSTGRINSWLWSFGDGTSSKEQNPVHTYTRAGVFDVSLTVSGPDGGANVAMPAMITVTELIEPPVAKILINTTTGDAPLAVRFTDASTGDVTTRTWDFGDGKTGAESEITHLYLTSGTYTTRLIIKGPGGESQSEQVIEVNEPISVPKASFSSDMVSGDAPLTVSFMDTSSGSISNWNWNFGDGSSSSETNPMHLFTSPGSFQVILSVNGPGGISHYEKGIIVNEVKIAPFSSFTADTTEGVAPLKVSFNDSSSGNISTWNWSFGDSTSSTERNPIHTYSSAGSYTVKETVNGPGGENYSEKGIVVGEPLTPIATVTPVPVVSITPVEIIVPDVAPSSSFTTDTTEGVTPLKVSFSDSSSGNISTWTWDFGDGTSSTVKSPVHTYSLTGSYTVRQTVIGPGGENYSEEGIVVNEPPTPIATVTPVPVVSIIPAENQEPEKLVPIFTPAIKKGMVARFTTSGNEGSAPLSVRFRDNSIGDITARSWDFGDGTGSSDQNPSHTYTKPGNYVASLTLTGPEGTQRSDLSVILVTSLVAPPKAIFSLTQSNDTAPLTIDFTDTSTGTISTWNWDFGDGTDSSEKDPSHIYIDPGLYTASLTVRGPAGESRTDTQIVVRLHEEPVPSSQLTGLQEPITPVQHTGNETPNVVTQTTLPIITPEATAQLSDDAQEGPEIVITADKITGSAPLTVSFSSKSAMNADQYEWLFGDGSTSRDKNPIHTYSTSGVYDLTLTQQGKAGSEKKVIPAYITVTEPVPLNAAIQASVGEGPAPLQVIFTPEVIGEVSGYHWDFGDETTSSEKEPTHIYQEPGSYNISLEVEGLWGATTTTLPEPIRVHHASVTPTARITADVVNGTAPLRTAFQAETTGQIDGYAWDFGDGESSYEQNPVHIYSTAGNYSVKVVIAGPEGSADIKLNTPISVLEGVKTPVCGFTASPVSGYAPLNVSFTDESSGSISQYDWSLGDGTASNEQSPMHTYTTPGTYTVGLQVTGQAGNAIEIKKDLIAVEKIPKAPVARFKADIRSGNVPLEIHFQDLSSGVVNTWEWDLGDGNSTLEKDPVMTYTKPGVYTVTETITGPGGKDVAIRRGYITVLAPKNPPVAVIYAEPVDGMAPMTVKFLDMSTGSVTGWHWDLGDGSVSANKNPTHIYQDEGTYSVNLHVFGPEGENNATTVIRVSPHEGTKKSTELLVPESDQKQAESLLPGIEENQSETGNITEDTKLVAAFSLSGRSGRSPLTITFHDRSSGQVTGWQWVFGDGEMSDLQDPTHTYQEPGVYTVALAVTGPDGTSQKRIREAVQVF